MAENYDANDVEKLHGLDRVRQAFAAREMPFGDDAPFPEENEGPARLEARPFVWRDEATIPPRQWLYGTHLIRKFLSVDVAAGGVGKSSLKIVEALAMTSGEALLGKPVHDGPLRVWLYNLEDPDEETERRVHAARRHYRLDPRHLGDRLFVNSGRDQPVVIAEETAGGARIVRPVASALVEAIRANKIDVLILDPFVSAHAVSENDNRAIDLVAKEFGRIADVCNCSINLIHHVRKGGGQEATADSARGASALIGAARSVIVFNRMSKDEAEQAGISPDQAGFHFRTQNDKANLAPPEAADWHRMNNVELSNGDHVGVACRWEWPDAFAGVTTAKLKEVQRAVAEGQWRRDTRAANWVGNIIAQVLGMDPVVEQKRIGQIVKEWIRNEVLREVERDDEARRPRKFVEVGRWVTE